MTAVQIGNCELYLGDCMELMTTLPDKSIDLAIVDPPYFNGPNIPGYYGNGYSKTGVKHNVFKEICKWDVPKQEDYNELCKV
jgi:site-specific DNA-methyltransferase (adenine-specific)